MKDQKIIDLIRTRMSGYDGTQPGPFPTQTTAKVWARDMYAWAVAVRRDILVLEYHLQNLAGKPLELYGDPGDPPPPPPDM